MLVAIGCRSTPPAAQTGPDPPGFAASTSAPCQLRPNEVEHVSADVRPASYQEETRSNSLYSEAGIASDNGQQKDLQGRPQMLDGDEIIQNPVLGISQSDSDNQISESPSATTTNPVPNKLQLDDILTSTKNCYPLIEVAIGEIETAEGRVLSSWGEFDTFLSAHSISEPLGFYQNYRNGLEISQRLYGGGAVYGAYRIGDGKFAPWYGERETNEGGEFKAGFTLPLIKDRDIDAARAALLSAQAQRNQVGANVQARLLELQRFATQAYWDWVAAGRAVIVQQQLLQLAHRRVAQINERVEKGDLPEIARIDNQRFIASRTNSLIKARRGFEKASIKLSLFYRDADCMPMIATSSQLPDRFPDSRQISREEMDSGILQALEVRPEFAELLAAQAQVDVDRNYGRNLTLPKLNVIGYASQDIGAPASSTGDKTPFELQAGLLAELPLQRREGFGKIRSAEGKQVQINAKQRFLMQKITAEIQDAISAVNAAFDQIGQSRRNVQLAKQSLELGRKLFDAGDIDIIELNIYETAAATAELQLLEAHLEYFDNFAVYETAIRGCAF